jgi:hypothetical protein
VVRRGKKKDARVLPLMAAVRDGNLPAVQALCAKGVDPTAREDTLPWGVDGERYLTPLHFAFTRAINPAIGAWLVQQPWIALNVLDGFGRTPLLVAVARGAGAEAVAHVKALLSRGAEPRLADMDGNTPLFFLRTPHRTGGWTELYDALVAGGADPAHRNKAGKTFVDPLFDELVSPQRSGEIARILAPLVDRGATSARYRPEELKRTLQEGALRLGPSQLKASNALAAVDARIELAELYARGGQLELALAARASVLKWVFEFSLPGPWYYERGPKNAVLRPGDQGFRKHPDDVFWEVSVRGERLIQRSGPLGSLGTTTVETLPSPALAARRAKALRDEHEALDYQARLGLTQ